MKNETFTEVSEAPKRMSPGVRRGIAITFGATAALGLVGCATGEGTTPGSGGTLEPDYKVGQIELPADMVEDRAAVLEMCNTGEGADEMKQVWNDYFKLKYGEVEFIDALKNSTDFTYMNKEAVLNYGPATYKTMNIVAEDCDEVVWLAAQTPQVSGLPESAKVSLEEYRNSPIPDLYIDALQSIANNLPVTTEAASN